MAKSINAILLVLAAVILVPAASYAAGLGTITVRSALGQPLDAEIEVVAVQPGEDFQVRLASRDAYRDAGVDLSPALQGARFAIEKREGKTVIRVRTTQPVNDPFFSILVELQWPTGRLARQYTVLVDPIEYRTASAAASQTASTAPASTKPATPPAPVPALVEPSKPIAQAPAPAVAAATPVVIAPAASVTAPAPAPVQAPVAAAPASAPAAAPAKSVPVAASTPAPAPAQSSAAAREPVAAPAPVSAPTVSAPPVSPAPVMAAPAATPAVATAPAPPPVAVAPSTPARTDMAPTAAAPATARAPTRQSADATGTYQIKKGDTLGEIARKWKPDGVTYDQMLIGLYQTNRPAFIRDNINLIRAGATLFIPGRDDVLAINAVDAAHQVRMHMAAFTKFRQTAIGAGTDRSRISQAHREVITRRAGVKKSPRAL